MAVHPEDLNSVFRSTWRLKALCNSSSEGSDPLFWPLHTHKVQTHRQHTHTYKIFKKIKKGKKRNHSYFTAVRTSQKKHPRQ